MCLRRYRPTIKQTNQSRYYLQTTSPSPPPKGRQPPLMVECVYGRGGALNEYPHAHSNIYKKAPPAAALPSENNLLINPYWNHRSPERTYNRQLRNNPKLHAAPTTWQPTTLRRTKQYSTATRGRFGPRSTHQSELHNDWGGPLSSRLTFSNSSFHPCMQRVAQPNGAAMEPTFHPNTHKSMDLTTTETPTASSMQFR